MELNYVNPQIFDTSKTVASIAPNGFQPVLIWAWENAPTDLRDLSTNGGDEDYLAFIPNETNRYLYGYNDNNWSPAREMINDILREGTWFAPCVIDVFEIEHGIVYIGSHA